MNQSVAVQLPSAEDVGAWAKTMAAVGGVVGGLWALGVRIAKRRRLERERKAQEARAIRYLLDAVRHALNVIVPSEDRRFVDVDELVRQKLLIDQVRDALWRYDGHESERATEQATERIVEVLTRTQRIKAKEQQQNPFKDGWTPEGEAKR